MVSVHAPRACSGPIPSFLIIPLSRLLSTLRKNHHFRGFYQLCAKVRIPGRLQAGLVQQRKSGHSWSFLGVYYLAYPGVYLPCLYTLPTPPWVHTACTPALCHWYRTNTVYRHRPLCPEGRSGALAAPSPGLPGGIIYLAAD